MVFDMFTLFLAFNRHFSRTNSSLSPIVGSAVQGMAVFGKSDENRPTMIGRHSSLLVHRLLGYWKPHPS